MEPGRDDRHLPLFEHQPAEARVNRGAWAELEDWVRRTVRYGGGRVCIVTGPVLEDGLPVLETPKATHQVRIPTRFFKVLADLTGPKPRASPS